VIPAAAEGGTATVVALAAVIVFLFLLPVGQLQRRGTSGVATTTSLAFFPLPSRHPRFCFSTKAPDPPMLMPLEEDIIGKI
jgi:hypothetical protein